MPLSLPAVAEERLQRSRKPPFAIREVRPQDGLERLRGPLVGSLALVREPFELGPDGIHVQGHADALQRREADSDRALDQDRVVIGRLRGEPGGERAIGQGQPINLDAISCDSNDDRGERGR